MVKVDSVSGQLQPLPPPKPTKYEGMWLAWKCRIRNLFFGPEDTIDTVFKEVLNDPDISWTKKLGCFNWLAKKHLQCIDVAKIMTLTDKNLQQVIAKRLGLDRRLAFALASQQRVPPAQPQEGSRAVLGLEHRNWQWLYSNMHVLLQVLPPDQRDGCVSIFRNSTTISELETKIFELLREVIKSRLGNIHTLVEKPAPLLPSVQTLFPASPQLIQYARLADQLCEIYQNVQKMFVAPEDITFANKLLDELNQSQFLYQDLQRATKTLGRLLFLIDHADRDAIRSFKDTYSTVRGADLIEKTMPMVPWQPNIFAVAAIEQAGVESAVIKRFVSALIRPNGSINTWLIPDLKEWIKEQDITGSFAGHFDKVLSEIQSNSMITELLASSPIPTVSSEGAMVVRASCNLDPNSSNPVTLADVNKTVLAALLTQWRQFYFGSCYTTGPLMAVRDTSIEVVLREFQEILSTGRLTRMVQGKRVTFRALLTQYPALTRLMLDKPVPPDDAGKKRVAQRLAAEPCLQEAWRLLNFFNTTTSVEPHSLGTLEAWLQKFLMKNPPKFSLDDIVRAMPLPSKQLEFFWYHINSYYQNPLVQCWQNGMMSMHYLPLNYQSVQSPRSVATFSEALRETLSRYVPTGIWPFSTRNNPFENPTVFSDVDSPTLQSLRFAATPPQDIRSTHGIMNLCIEDQNHQWRPIENADDFFQAIDKVFFEIANEHLPPGKKKEIIEKISRELSLDGIQTPWFYNMEIETETSELWTTYLQSEGAFQGIPIENGDEGICSFRDWVKDQKKLFGDMSRLKVPAYFGSTRVWGHICNVLIDQEILDGEEDSYQWMNNARTDLNKLSCKELEPAISRILNKSKRLLFPEDVQKQKEFEERLKPAHLGDEGFMTWYRKLGKELKGKVTEEQMQELESFTYMAMIQSSTAIRKKLLHPFADTNWMQAERRGISQKNLPVYLAFALVPSLFGDSKWRTVETWGTQMKNCPLTFFELLKHPGFAYQLVPTQELLRVESKMQESFEQYTNDFCQAWKKLMAFTDPTNIEKVKNELLEIRKNFRATITAFRESHQLEVNQELFVTMNKRQDAPGATEALFAKTDEEFSQLFERGKVELAAKK